MYVRDIIVNTPENNPYDKLKEALIARTELSVKQRINKLLNGEINLGDQTPSQLLRNMKQLSIDNNDDLIFNELFLQKLPDNVRSILATLPQTTSIEDLAKTADAILETSSIKSINKIDNNNEDLHKSFNALQLEINQLRSEIKSQNKKNQNYFGRNTNENYTNSDLCWYHFTFGRNAKKCRSPCKMSENFKYGH